MSKRRRRDAGRRRGTTILDHSSRNAVDPFRITRLLQSGAGAKPAYRYFDALVTHSVVTDLE